MEEDGRGVIRTWAQREGISVEQQSAIQLLLDLIESGGPECVPGSIVRVAGDFWGLNIRRKDHMLLTPIFCYGPFGENELTLLAGAPIERGLLKAKDVLPVAQHNLEILRVDRRRRRRERIA